MRLACANLYVLLTKDRNSSILMFDRNNIAIVAVPLVSLEHKCKVSLFYYFSLSQSRFIRFKGFTWYVMLNRMRVKVGDPYIPEALKIRNNNGRAYCTVRTGVIWSYTDMRVCVQQ